MKVAHSEMPQVTRSTRKELDPKVAKELADDVAESFDFLPHAATDGQTYDTASEAQSAASIAIRSVAHARSEPENMFRRRVWDTNGQKDRKKKGKWVFALTRRKEPPKPRKPRQTAEPANAS